MTVTVPSKPDCSVTDWGCLNDWRGLDHGRDKPTARRFVIETDGLACCLTCGAMTTPRLGELPGVAGTSEIIARC